MKKSKLWLLVALVLIVTCLFAVSCDEEHTEHGGLTNVTIVTEPGESTEGKVTATCACGDALEIAVPALNDTTFWQANTTAATCTADGKTVYTSVVYKDIVYTVVLPKVAHAFGAWEITTEPTEDTTGAAKRTCTCGEVENATLPVLTDITVWSKVVDPAADHLNTGKAIYTSVYGSVNVTIDTVPHEWGSWVITEEPTKTETGAAEQSCSCGTKNPVTLPVLTDEAVWGTPVVTPADHDNDGSEVYTSATYGVVTVTLDKIDIVWAWTITEEPTVTEGGVASATCSCGNTWCEETDSFDLPALTDATVWTTHVNNPADYNEPGSDVYTSAYGTVTIVLPKLVAPYDNMAYYAVQLNGADEDLNGNGADFAWIYSSNPVNLNANGEGFSNAVPGRGYWRIEMVDAATGKIALYIYDVINNDDSNLDESDVITDTLANYASNPMEGYVDFETGMIALKGGAAWDYAWMLLPVENAINRSDVEVSVWNASAMAFSYTEGEDTYTAFFTTTTVTFGTTFTGENGEAVAANACYNAPYLFVKKGELQIAAYGYDGEKMNVLDELYGTYTEGENTVKVSGYGTLVYNSSMNGIYTVAPAGAAYDLDVYMLNEGNKVMYLQITLGDGNTYTSVQPMADITFVGGDYATVDPQNRNINIAFILPNLAPNDETKLLIGWSDGTKTYAPGEAYIPVADATLTAVWGDKCVITLEGVMAGDATTVYLVPGELILSKLPAYTNLQIDTATNRYFIGWFADLNENGEIDADDAEIGSDTDLPESLSALTIIAKWEQVPVYYGTYVAFNIYGTNTVGSAVTINIALDGTVTGKFSGSIKEGYNAENHTLTLSDNIVAHVDFENGLISTPFSSGKNYTGDCYLFVRDLTSGDKSDCKTYGLEGPSSTTWTYRLFSYPMNGETKIALITNEKVYADVTLTDALGNALTAVTVNDAKTLVVKTADGVKVLALCAENATFGTGSNAVVALGAEQGTYTVTGSDDVLKLDGAGNAMLGDKTGVYTVNGTACEVYLADNTEYYAVTLDINAGTCTMEKPMVELTFDANMEGLTQAPISVNKNVSATLPTLEKTGYVFRGWYVAGAEETIYTTYAPTAAVTLIAKWDVLLTLTVDTVGGELATTPATTWGAGDIITLGEPALSGKRFLGWYTTATYEEGTEWTDGSAITATLALWAKWGDPVKGWGSYTGFRLYNGSDTYSSAKQFYIDEAGRITGDYTGNLADINAETKTLQLVNSYNTKYTCYFDADLGIMLVPNSSGTQNFVTSTYVMVKGMTEDDADGITHQAVKKPGTSTFHYRVVTFTANDITTTLLITEKELYSDITVTDAYGATLAAADIKNSKTLMVKQGDTVIVMLAASNDSFGTGYTSNCSSTITLDGLQGSYTPGGSDVTVKLDGAGNIIYGDKTGTYAVNGDAYDVYLNGGTEYYVLTLDVDAKTYTITKPVYTVTFNTTFGDVTVNATEANKNIAFALGAPTKTGYKFRGWYVDANKNGSCDDGETLYTDTYTVTGDEAVTLTAKWDVGYAYKVHFNNEGATADIDTTLGAGDIMSLDRPIFTGHQFLGWYTTATFDEGTEWSLNNTGIAANTELYAKWGDPVKGWGTYFGYETEREEYTRNSEKTLIIDEYGVITGSYAGNLSDWDADTKLITLNNKICYFDPDAGIFAMPYNSNYASDGWLLVKGFTASDKSSLVHYAIKAAGSNDWGYRLISYVLNDTTYTCLLTVDKAYAGISVVNGQGVALTVAEVKNAQHVRIMQGDMILAELVADGASFAGGTATKSLDGTQGTYTNGSLGVIVSAGSGTLTVAGGEAVAYTLADGKLYFNYNNKHTVITLGVDAYTVVADGFAGTYTLPDGVATYKLDGFGVVEGVGTYTIDGTTVTVYVTGGESTTYGLDAEGKTLLGKSPFAGLTFSGTYKDSDGDKVSWRIDFDDAANISGGIYVYYGDSWYFYFTGVLEGNTLTLTIGDNIIDGSTGTANHGKTVVFEINGDTMTVVSCEITNNTYTFGNEGTLTCEGFSL